jgi:hypothetical protein
MRRATVVQIRVGDHSQSEFNSGASWLSQSTGISEAEGTCRGKKCKIRLQKTSQERYKESKKVKTAIADETD